MPLVCGISRFLCIVSLRVQFPCAPIHQVLAKALEALRTSLKQSIAQAKAEADPTLLTTAMDDCLLDGMEEDDLALETAREALKEIEIEFAVKRKRTSDLQVRIWACVCINWVFVLRVYYVS